MKRYFLKIIPYLFALCFGLILYYVAIKSEENIRSLFINIASVFIAIPLLFIIYELIQKYSKRKLNKEIFDFAKLQIDIEFMGMCHQLIKLIYPYEKQNNTFKGINNLLNLTSNDIKNEMSNDKYFAFQSLKNWYINEKNIQDLLNNSFIINKLNDDQIISIINVLKNVRSLQNIYRNINDLYIISDNKIDGFTIQSGLEMNPDNSKYPDRFLLLKNLEDDKYQVFDFGDFEKFKVSKLLFECSVNPKYIDLLSTSIYDTLQSINKWLEYTGFEFIIDTRMYKIRRKN